MKFPASHPTCAAGILVNNYRPKRVSPWLRASNEMVVFWNYTTRGSPQQLIRPYLLIN
jgi:hypothetical protein